MPNPCRFPFTQSPCTSHTAHRRSRHTAPEASGSVGACQRCSSRVCVGCYVSYLPCRCPRWARSWCRARRLGTRSRSSPAPHRSGRRSCWGPCASGRAAGAKTHTVRQSSLFHKLCQSSTQVAQSLVAPLLCVTDLGDDVLCVWPDVDVVAGARHAGRTLTLTRAMTTATTKTGQSPSGHQCQGRNHVSSRRLQRPSPCLTAGESCLTAPSRPPALSHLGEEVLADLDVGRALGLAARH